MHLIDKIQDLEFQVLQGQGLTQDKDAGIEGADPIRLGQSGQHRRGGLPGQLEDLLIEFITRDDVHRVLAGGEPAGAPGGDDPPQPAAQRIGVKQGQQQLPHDSLRAQMHGPADHLVRVHQGEPECVVHRPPLTGFEGGKIRLVRGGVHTDLVETVTDRLTKGAKRRLLRRSVHRPRDKA